MVLPNSSRPMGLVTQKRKDRICHVVVFNCVMSSSGWIWDVLEFVLNFTCVFTYFDFMSKGQTY